VAAPLQQPNPTAAPAKPAGEKRPTVIQEIGVALGNLVKFLEGRKGSYTAAEAALAKAFIDHAKPLAERMSAEKPAEKKEN
jgi:hypothetical protein